MFASSWADPLTKVDFVVRFQVPLLVEAAATDGAAVGFLSGVDQLVPLQLVGVREFLAAGRAVVPDLFFGLFQQLRRNVHRDANHFPAGALLHYSVKEKHKMALKSNLGLSSLFHGLTHSISPGETPGLSS